MQEQNEELDPQLFHMCEEFCQKVRRTNQQLYKQFTQIVTPGYKNPREQLGELLSEDPDLLKDLNQMLEDEVKYKTMKERLIEYVQSEPSKHRAMDSIIKQVQNQQLDYVVHKDLILELFSGEPILQNLFLQSVKKKNEPPKKKPDTLYFQKLLDKNGTIFADMKNDLLFWDKFRNRVMTQYPDNYQDFINEFLKIVHLYSECIITQIEFMDIINQLDWLEREYIDDLRNMITARVVARRYQTQLFKPLKDTDFTSIERLTRSYVRMPQGYAKAKHDQHLNHDWVSVPFGSEDQSFLIMRKNTFEEQLFKSEDERFEFDVNILQMKRTIKIVQKIMDNEEIDQQQIIKAIDMRIIQQLYRNQSQDQNEILQIFQTRPQDSAKIIIKRVKQKLAELLNARNTKAKLIWDNVSLNNFHRSLDHRSFYFKKNDKIIVCGQRFVREIEEQAKTVSMKYLGTKDHVYLKRKPEAIGYPSDINYLNSLFQLTNIRPVQPKQVLLPEINEFNVRQIPLMLLWFGNPFILQDTAQFIIHYLQIMGGNSSPEKKQGSLLFIKILNILFNVPIVPLQINQLVMEEVPLKQEMQQMESYEISYNPDDILYNIDADLFKSNNIEGQYTDSVDLLPKSKQMLFITQNIYVLLRFFHIVYQRLELAYTISKQNLKGQDRRYILFKSTLFLSLKAKDFKYEDHLRSLFGKMGFLFSTLEKVLHDSAKQIVTCIQDPCSTLLLEFGNNDTQLQQFDKMFQTITAIANSTHIQLNDLNTQVLFQYEQNDENLALAQLYEYQAYQKADKRPVYRITYTQNTCFINILPSYCQSSMEKGYLNQLPFMRRNLNRDQRIINKYSDIEWTQDEFCHMRPIGKLKEDYLRTIQSKF